MRRFSITDKLVIASFLISSIIIFIVASYSFYHTKIAILDRTFDQLNSVREIKTNLLLNFFENAIQDIELAKNSTDVKNILKAINKQKLKAYYTNCSQDTSFTDNIFLQKIAKTYYDELVILGKNKCFCSSQKGLMDTLYYDFIWNKVKVHTTPFIEDYYWDKTKQHYYLSVATSIGEGQANEGIIIFKILPEALDSIMLNRGSANGLGESGESYIVGKDKQMRTSSRFQSNSIMKTIVNTVAVNEAYQQNVGTKIIDDYRGVRVLSSFRRMLIPDLDWVVIAEIDYQEATIPIFKTRREIVFISIFIFLIVLLVILVLSRRITYPIQRLSQAVQRVGEGDLNVHIPSYSEDEIGDLSQAFNRMVEKLKTQGEDLETERAKSLQSLIDGQESERQRLSRELHDGLGQLLIALKLKFENCIRQKEDGLSLCLDLEALFDTTIEETRRMSNNLMPASLMAFGLQTSIRSLCNEVSQITGIHIYTSFVGDRVEPDSKQTIYLFRIIQEGLTNIVKHANASDVYLKMIFVDNEVIIELNDNGIGFVAAAVQKKGSNGLKNIQDRIDLLSGEFRLQSTPQKGTRIWIKIPLLTKPDRNKS